MKKRVEEVLKLLLGIVLGLLVIFQFSEDRDVRSFFEFDLGIQRTWQWEFAGNGYIPLLIYVLCSMVGVLIITYIIRNFTNTRNIKKTAGFLNVFIQIFLGVPVTTMLYVLADPWIQKINLDVLFRVCIGAIIYSVVFEMLCLFFEKAFYEKLQKGHKRCKLIVCTVLSDDNYEEGTVIVDRMTYEDCYSAMKNNQEQLTIRQFFKIVEMNWNGKKEVDSWRYYQNGDFIRITDQELCKKLMVSEYSSQVQWQG